MSRIVNIPERHLRNDLHKVAHIRFLRYIHLGLPGLPGVLGLPGLLGQKESLVKAVKQYFPSQNLVYVKNNIDFRRKYMV